MRNPRQILTRIAKAPDQIGGGAYLTDTPKAHLDNAIPDTGC